MQNRKIIAMMAGAMLLLWGCIREDWAPEGVGVDGMTQIALSIGDPQDVRTRSVASANECKIDDAYLLLFDAAGKYKAGEKVQNSNIRQSDSNPQAPVITTPLVIEGGDNIVVLLNTGVASLPSGLTVGTTTANDLNVLFPADAWNLNPQSADTFGRGMPMSGEAAYTAGTKPTVQIRRSAAKIQLALNIAAGDDVTGTFNAANVNWGMYNVLKPTKGAVYAPKDVVTTISGLTSGDFENNEDFLLTDISSGDNYEQTFYMPEYPNAEKAKQTAVVAETFAADRTCMVVRVGTSAADYQYYRLDLYDHTAKKFIDIRRNTHITVTITKVTAFGYATPDEAIANPSGNLKYEIKVTDPDNNIVVSNGQYGLALDYDEVIYTGDTNTEVSLGRVRGVAPTGMALPTTNAIIASADVELRGAASISTSPQEVKAIMKRGTSGTVTLKLGNIEKVIKLIRLDVIHAAGAIITLPGDYSAVTWTKEESALRVMTDGAASSVIVADENVTPTDPAADNLEFTPRSAEGYVFRAGAAPGYTKISITQGAPRYVGWFGGTPDNSGDRRYSKRLILDSHDAPTTLTWNSAATSVSAYNAETGLENAKTLMAQSNPESFQAAYYCYMLNDRNGDGVVDADEPVEWYLPAQNQLMAVYIAQNSLSTTFNTTYYWTSSGNLGGIWRVNFNDGDTAITGTNLSSYRVRCVRDM